MQRRVVDKNDLARRCTVLLAGGVAIVFRAPPLWDWLGLTAALAWPIADRGSSADPVPASV